MKKRVCALAVSLALLSAPAAQARSYRLGDRADEIAVIQTALTELDLYYTDITGRFGQRTERAVKLFQRKVGLPQTGVADEQTLNLLYLRTNVEAPAAVQGGGAPSSSAGAISAGQMLRAPQFWVLAAWNISLRTAGLVLLDHAASMAVHFGGAALTAMLIAPANGLGSMTVGFAFDRLGGKRIMRIDAFCMLGSAAMLVFGTAAVFFFLSVLTHHDKRCLNCRNAGKNEIKKNERIRVESV